MKTILEVGHQADLGLIRTQQEDAYALQVNPPNPLSLRSKGTIFIVADGVGGYQAGELASRIAAGSIINKYYADFNENIVTSLKHSIETVNKEINQSAIRDGLARMSTTVVCAVIREDELYVAHVGDSRAYLARAGQLVQLTADHSWVAEQVRLGQISEQEALTHPQRNLVTRSLGIKPQVEVDVRLVGKLQDGDRVLLCTDGLYENVPAEELSRVLVDNPKPQHACGELIRLANLAGGSDNITVIVVGVQQVPSSVSEEGVPALKPNSAGDLKNGTVRPVSPPPVAFTPVKETVPVMEVPPAIETTPVTEARPTPPVIPDALSVKPVARSLQAHARPFSYSLVEGAERSLPASFRVRWEIELAHESTKADEPPWSYEITLPSGIKILIAVRFSTPDIPAYPELVEIFAGIGSAGRSCLLAHPGVTIDSLKRGLSNHQKLVIILNLNETVQIIDNHGISIMAHVIRCEWTAEDGKAPVLSSIQLNFLVDADLDQFVNQREVA